LLRDAHNDNDELVAMVVLDLTVSETVIPANAGIQQFFRASWIPAFAGMT